MKESKLEAEKIHVAVKPLLMELAPGYLLRRHEEATQLSLLLQAADFDAIQSIGHKLSGNASTYGFHEISRIGVEIENAAQCKETSKIEQLIERYSRYLSRIEIIAG